MLLTACGFSYSLAGFVLFFKANLVKRIVLVVVFPDPV